MKLFLKRVLLALLGFTVIGFSVSILRVADLGIDPLGAMCLGISDHTGLSFGALLIIVQSPLLLMVFIRQRKLVGLGTIIGMFGIGYVVDFFFFIFTNIGVVDLTIPLPIRISIMLIALVILCTGASIYMTADLGMIPYDSAGFVFEEMTNGKLKFKWIRLGMDASCAIAAILLGATVGIASAATVFCAGPLIAFLKPRVGKLLENKFLLE